MLNRLRGLQTLAGDMRGNGGTDVAIIDPCLPNNPIVFEWRPALTAQPGRQPRRLPKSRAGLSAMSLPAARSARH